MYTNNRGRETVCFVIRAVPYKESSLIIDALSMDMGRISFVAKGARNVRSSLKSMLQLFTPIKVTLKGLNNGLKTLVECEQAGKQISFLPPTLFSALYLNELIYFLYKIEDDSTGLFSAYTEALNMMLDERKVEMALRNFELTMMEELGVGIDFYHESDSEKVVNPHTWYLYRLNKGFIPINSDLISSNINVDEVCRGADLLNILERKYTPSSLRAAKRICRQNIQSLLNGRELMSRKLYLEYIESDVKYADSFKDSFQNRREKANKSRVKDKNRKGCSSDRITSKDQQEPQVDNQVSENLNSSSVPACSDV